MILTSKVSDDYKRKFYDLMIENNHFDFSAALGFKNWKGYAPQEMVLNTYKIKYKLPVAILEFHKITSINLHNCKLTGFPKELTDFKDLKSIDLSCNNLTTLPAYIAQLKDLEELDLSFNELKEFPSAVAKLTKLRKLNLEHTGQGKLIPDDIRVSLSQVEILT